MIIVSIENEEHMIVRHGESGTSTEIQAHRNRSLVTITTPAGSVDVQVLPDGRRVVHESETGGITLEQRIDSVLKSLAGDISMALVNLRGKIADGALMHLDKQGRPGYEDEKYIDDAARAIDIALKPYGVKL